MTRIRRETIIFRAVWAGAALFGLCGCGGQRMERVPGPGDTVTLKIGGKTVTAEVVLDDASRERGLMFRKELPEDHGMLFIWPDHKRYSFWMRNTTVPLSVAFIDDEGKILQIEDMQPKDERQTWSKDEVRHALEVNQGWFAKNGLKPGAVFEDFRKTLNGLVAR